MVAWWRALDQVAMEESMFFFEEKNQKTLNPGLSLSGKAEAKNPKVFCFFFSKKKALTTLLPSK
jgi:hypothetical protein